MMFTRLLLQLIRGSRGRLVVALVALISGAAVVSSLLNLSSDIQNKLSQEFQTLGANVVVAPPAEIATQDAGSTTASLIDQSGVMSAIETARLKDVLAASPFLFVVTRVNNTPVVLTGTWLDQARALAPTWKLDGNWVENRDDLIHCLVGKSVARRFSWRPGDAIQLDYLGRSAHFEIQGVIESGDTADDHIFVNLPAAQDLAGISGRISLVQLSVNPAPGAVASVTGRLQSALPGLQVSPIREVTQAEGDLLQRIHLLVISMVVLILALTALCVLATIAALAMERRTDVGLMKALGGSIARVMSLFVAEVAILAAVGGILGWALGIGLSQWMGHRVFGTAISTRWEVLPVTMALVIIVAIAGALPLRALGRVKAAVILRGE
jgi:putative ABC transport system permease protein